jgi:hypothetical protein
MTQFSMSFSPESLKEITAFYGFGMVLQPEVQEALTQISTLLATKAQDKTWAVFMNPSGQLASTIAPLTTSPYEAQVMVGSPYGHRREYSFKGPDSLGRMFPNDPAEPYLEPTLAENEQAMLAILEEAVQAALQRMGG